MFLIFLTSLIIILYALILFRIKKKKQRCCVCCVKPPCSSDSQQLSPPPPTTNCPEMTITVDIVRVPFNSTQTVTVTGGTPPYLYQKELFPTGEILEPFQSDNTFGPYYNISPGQYFRVRDSNGCESISGVNEG